MSVLCLGEFLVDCFDDARLPGGAPANVACHVAALGERAALVSRLGEDPDGRRLRAWLSDRRVAADLLQSDAEHSTGTVLVTSGPRYEIAEAAAWDFIEPNDANLSAATDSGSVVFGTLAQRQPESRRTIRTLVAAAQAAGVPVLCDLNLRAPYYDEETVIWSVRNCDLLKLNREELELVSRMLLASGDTGTLFEGLLREFGIPCGVLTLGEEGALFCQDGMMWRQPAEAIELSCDAVGAGDAFTAVLSVALARGIPLRQAGPAAASLAAFVATQRGAAPPVPAPLAARVSAMLSA